MNVKYQPAPKADMKRTIDAFEPIEEKPKPVLDRSTLEAWATCPFLGHQIETGQTKVVGEIAVAGDLVHEAFMAAVKTWLAPEAQASPKDCRHAMEAAVRYCRPDLQPDVWQAVKPAVWEWIELLTNINIGNILAFDGGEEFDRSGQLATDLLDIRFTSELDFLYQGRSQGWLNIEDLKSGWKKWTDDDVYDSFQFQSHAVLALENFPDAEGVLIRIWNTRRNTRTGRVLFKRDDLPRFKGRLIAAVQARGEALASGVIPAWPTEEKCRLCPVVLRCPHTDSIIQEQIDNVALLQKAHVMQEGLAKIKEILAARVDSDGGQDIVTPIGCFGRNKPKTERKAPAVFYSSQEEE